MTRFLVAVPLKNKSAVEVAKAMFTQVICAHGAPEIVVTDQGKEFLNQVFKELTEQMQISHLKTSV